MFQALFSTREWLVGDNGRPPRSPPPAYLLRPPVIPVGPPRLPAELTDRIIDYFHDDKKTLKDCALVHSSWLPTSRFHLFYTITPFGVREKTSRMVRFESIIAGSPLALSIIPYIKIVEIESLLDPNRAAARLMVAANFIGWVRRCCDLMNLPPPSVRVSQGWSRLGSGDNLTSSLSQAGDITTHVKLSHVVFPSSSDIWTFLSSFPRLQCLELSDIEFHNSVEPGSFPAPGLFDGVPLSKLRMTTKSMGFVISGLIRVAGSLSHLDDLGITYQDIRQVELPQLAKAIQKRVNRLRLSVSCCYPGGEGYAESRPSTFDVGIWEFVCRFRSLSTLILSDLRVDGSGSNRRDGSDVSFEWITGVLQQLSSPIQTLVLEVTATSYLQFEAIPWASIDMILNPEASQFRELTCVRVLVKRGVVLLSPRSVIGRDVVFREIIQRLPALHLLGLLRCDTEGC